MANWSIDDNDDPRPGAGACLGIMLALLITLMLVAAVAWAANVSAADMAVRQTPAPMATVTGDGVITVEWIDGTTVDICTTAPGYLYVLSGGGWWIATLDAGCRAYPQPGQLIDAAFAPTQGRVYGLITADGVLHRAEPLPRWWPVVLHLPVVAR